MIERNAIKAKLVSKYLLFVACSLSGELSREGRHLGFEEGYRVPRLLAVRMYSHFPTETYSTCSGHTRLNVPFIVSVHVFYTGLKLHACTRKFILEKHVFLEV